MPGKRKVVVNKKRGSRILNSTARHNVITVFGNLKKKYEKERATKSNTELICEVAYLFEYSFNTVKSVLKDHEMGKPVVTPKRNKKYLRPVRDQVDEFGKEAIARYIYQKAHEGKVLSGKEILEHVRENYDTYFFQGSYSSLYRILKEMDFVWKKGDKYAICRERDDVIIKRHYFLGAYNKNKASENPQPVIFLDETWIYMNGSSTYCWMKRGSTEGIVRRPAEGRRLVVLHAGTRAGFVPGSALLFTTNLKTGQDYHGAMNSSTFESWVKNQLIPGIHDLGPSIIVMDNASYHSREAERQPTLKWKKEDIITWLTHKGVLITDGTKEFLMSLARTHMRSSKLYVVDEMLRAEGHTVLRLPPYHSMFNAIEYVWSQTKGYFDKNVLAGPGQGMDRARHVWKEALEQVSPENWSNSVDHAEKIMQEYVVKDSVNDSIDEFIISVSSESETDTAEEDFMEEDPIPFTPLEPIAGPSTM